VEQWQVHIIVSRQKRRSERIIMKKIPVHDVPLIKSLNIQLRDSGVVEGCLAPIFRPPLPRK
jgi:hypothetical protein